jgi:hypothetical protein
MRNDARFRNPGSRKRVAVEKKKDKSANLAGDSSAHPQSPNYDPTYARAIMGDLAEEVRQWLAKNYDARPPGLDTRWEEDSGNMLIVADCPDEGLGVEVEIRPLGGGMGPGTPDQAAPNATGIGPDLGAALVPDQGPPPDQGALPPDPAAALGSPSAGIGPQPMPPLQQPMPPGPQPTGLPPATPGPASGPQIGPAM